MSHYRSFFLRHFPCQILILFFLLIGARTITYGEGIVLSDPVGMVQITLKAGSDSRIGLPLDRSFEFQGAVDSIEGNTLKVSGEVNWTENLWAPGYPDGDRYYLILMSGTEEGMFLPITASGVDSITLDLARESLDSVATQELNGEGDVFRIVPYWTPHHLFADVDLPSQTLLYLYDSYEPAINKAPSQILTYWEGYGWYDASFALSDYTSIARGKGVVLRLPDGASDVDLYLKGAVPMMADRKRIPMSQEGPVDLAFSLSTPTAYSLGSSGLGLSDQVLLYQYDNDTIGINRSPSQVLTYWDGFGWYDGSFNEVDESFVLNPKKGYVLRLPQMEEDVDIIVSRKPVYLTE